MRAFAEGKTHTSKFANNIQDGGLCYNAGIGVSAILSRKTCIIDVHLKESTILNGVQRDPQNSATGVRTSVLN